jgi:5'-deoxynucleotidase YfbR-like HD superfamily hydrolase
MTVLRWHANADRRLRDSGDTIDGHQMRVVSLCVSLAASIGHPLHDSDLPLAAIKHDEAERVLGDMPGPAKYRFPALAAAYAEVEKQVLTEMGYDWTLTDKEQDMLTLCDKLDAWVWARDHGVTGGEWDCALANLRIMAHKLDCTRWLDDYIK